MHGWNHIVDNFNIMLFYDEVLATRCVAVRRGFYNTKKSNNREHYACQRRDRLLCMYFNC